MEKKEIKRVLERIYRFLKDNKGRLYVDDCETVTLYEGMSEIIEQELDKAREEGRREGSEITSRYISDFVKSESGKSGRKEILEYIEELSKLKQ
jgi:hypothetical protein